MEILDYLLEKRFVRPSTSQFAAPIPFTPKKDGGLCMCIDYCALNRVSIKSRYPIPCADNLIDQLRVHEADCYKTVFRIRYGSYEYTVIPFGLTSVPSTFQSTMNETFRPLLDKCVIVYLDDILVYNTTREQHSKDLEAVFSLLQQNRLITKGSECEFLKHQLELLGHVISIDGVKMDPKNIATIQDWKPPANPRELQNFMEFVNYVRRFIPNMAGVTPPLTVSGRRARFLSGGESSRLHSKSSKCSRLHRPFFGLQIPTVHSSSSPTPAIRPLAPFC
ncbi:hypothetical protein CLOM_g3400 [Closterium sp. NIES-68]|nr:hypothetical protein CLOM_g3400 [Closterium sp. NIES-68]